MRLSRYATSFAALATLAAFTALPVPPAYADTGTETYIVQLKSGVSADQVVPQLMGSDAEVVDKVFQGGIADLDSADAAALARNPLVSSIQRDQVITLATTESKAPWAIDELDSPTAAMDGSYTYPNDGSGVTVYVLDTGIQRTHNQFANAKIAAGYDFIDNDTDPSDCEGHGTAIASLVAGSTLGAAKGVTIVPLRVMDCAGNGTSTSVIRAAQWIAANHVPGSPAVANLSLGGPGSLLGNSAQEAALQSLINSGVSIVVSAGNSAANACSYDPASLPDAITVAATDKAHAEASFSNYGSCVDLYAPGVDVDVAWIGANSTYMVASGTSASAPLTSAAVALILHDHPTFTPAQVRAELMAQAITGRVTGPGGIAARSVNKLLHVGTATIAGTVPTITGTPFVGATLTTSPHWSPTPSTLTYQWKRNDVAISAATKSTYVVTSADAGQTLTVAVAGSTPGYYDVSATSVSVKASTTPVPGMLVTLTPSRLVDTRAGLGATGPVLNGQTVKIPVAGVGNIMASTSAVLINLTVTDATSSGYVTAYASGGAKPATSNENFTAGRTIANLALVPVGADGAIALTVSSLGGSVSLVVDVQSYVAGGTVSDAGAVVPVTPSRLWDTRQHAVVGSNQALDVQVTGVAGVPVGATAVFLNVTVADPRGAGYLTAFPAGEAKPATSNLNFVPGLTVPNMALVKVGANGSISILDGSSGTAQIVVDIEGYVTAGTPTTLGAVVPVSPVRVVDTRIALGATGPVAASSGVAVTINGPTGTTGVFMNLTVTDTRTNGWVAAYPTQASLPLVSNLNFIAGQTVPNLATVGLASSRATLYNGSGATVQLVADVFAYVL